MAREEWRQRYQIPPPLVLVLLALQLLQQSQLQQTQQLWGAIGLVDGAGGFSRETSERVPCVT